MAEASLELWWQGDIVGVTFRERGRTAESLTANQNQIYRTHHFSITTNDISKRLMIDFEKHSRSRVATLALLLSSITSRIQKVKQLQVIDIQRIH